MKQHKIKACCQALVTGLVIIAAVSSDAPILYGFAVFSGLLAIIYAMPDNPTAK